MSALARALAASVIALATVAAAVLLAPAAGSKPAAAGPKLAVPADELVRPRPLPAPGGGAIERYRQRVGGLPVLGAEAVVARPAGEAPVVVADKTVPGLTAPAPARIGKARAIARARAASGAQRLRGPVRARLGVDPKSGRAAWEVVIPSARPLGDFLVTVDARSGKALRQRNLLKRATGTARVYDPNPVTTQGGYNGLKDNKDKDSPILNALLAPVTLERITSAKGCLSGEYVVAVLGRGKRAKKVCAPNADFSRITRSHKHFEAVMAYFHIDRTRAYIDSLGLTRGLRGKPQLIEVNSFPDDNSFFSPATRKMALGTGGVDDGEDADVIIHEYGHSVQDQAVHFFGQSSQGGAMGEGFADYLAAVMSSHSTLGNATYDVCMFEWDAVSYTKNKCARRTDSNLTMKRADRRCFGDPHCTGEVWSSALWKLRGALGNDDQGRAIMDRVVLQSHFMLTRHANFRQGARALIAADKLLYGGEHVPTIQAELVQRGFCKKKGC